MPLEVGDRLLAELGRVKIAVGNDQLVILGLRLGDDLAIRIDDQVAAEQLFLFMRDVTDNDFVGWIDRQLGAVDPQSPDRLAALREAIIGPLRNVYGVSDKVLAPASDGRCGSKWAQRSSPSTP